MRCGKDAPFERPDAPLIRAGINRAAVNAWWGQYAFDLGIPSLCGNCVFCFLKGEEKLQQIYQIMPDAIEFYIDIEKRWVESIPLRNGKGFFILPNGGYQGLKDRAVAGMPPPDPEDDIVDLECNCTD